MQICSWEAWEIWSYVVTSGRQRVGTQGRCPTVIISILCLNVPGIVNVKQYSLASMCRPHLHMRHTGHDVDTRS